MSKNETPRDPNEVLEEYEETLDSVLAEVESPDESTADDNLSLRLPGSRSVAETS